LSSAEKEGKGISRRGFLTGTGAFLLLGAAGLGRWDALESLLNPATGANSRGIRPPDVEVGHPFTVFWMTDTQYLSETNPALFSNMTGWIAKNWTALNGKMVVHTGDLVQTGDLLQEWVNADAAMKVLRDNGIPYLWCAGNHDDIIQDDPTAGWAGSQFDSFNPTVVSSKVNGVSYAKWAGDYRSGMNTAVAFSAGGLKFLTVNIEWNAPPDALAWFEKLLDSQEYASHYVIVAPHAYEDAFGSTNDARWGPVLEDFRQSLTDIMDRHTGNIFLTLNGHFATDSGYHTPKPVNGRNQLMFDRQESTDNPNDPLDSSVRDVLKVGGATVTILVFDTVQNTVNVSTYDVSSGQYRLGPLDLYSFPMLPDRDLEGLGPDVPTPSQVVSVG